MQEKKRRRWFYGRKGLNTSSPKSEANSLPGSPSAKLYRHIVDLPLSRFKECDIRGNLAALVISGYPDPSELEKAWFEIQCEYQDARGDAEYKAYLIFRKEVQLLKITLRQIHICIKQLSDILQIGNIDPGIVELKDSWTKELNKHLHTTFVFDFDQPDAFVHDLQRCFNRSKGEKIYLDLKEARLEALEQKFGEKKKADDAYYESLLISLSDAAGYQLKDDITVFQFCERITRLIQKNKAAAQQQQSGSRRINK